MRPLYLPWPEDWHPNSPLGLLSSRPVTLHTFLVLWRSYNYNHNYLLPKHTILQKAIYSSQDFFKQHVQECSTLKALVNPSSRFSLARVGTLPPEVQQKVSNRSKHNILWAWLIQRPLSHCSQWLHKQNLRITLRSLRKWCPFVLLLGNEN